MTELPWWFKMAMFFIFFSLIGLCLGKAAQALLGAIG